jgi:hemoglobin
MNDVSSLTTSKRSKMATLYEELGGEPAVDAAVDIFYRKVLQDERISRFFDDIDMDEQAAKQKAFLTMVMGGPAQYSGLDMRKGHAHLVARGLADQHVDAVVELLGQTLSELGVSAEKIAQVAALANSVRADVLNRPAQNCGTSCGCQGN